MTSTNISKKTTLYDHDFNLWLLATIKDLKARNFENIEIENLIEELDSLAKRDKRELKSRLRVLISHLLKRRYINNIEYHRGWELTIKEQRRELDNLWQQSPSLKNYFLEIFAETCQQALIECQDSYLYVQFPNDCPFPCDVNAILSEQFWQ